MEKLKSFIAETREYVLPLLRKAKEKYPADSDALFILKYHITSVVDSIDATLQAIEAYEVKDMGLFKRNKDAKKAEQSRRRNNCNFRGTYEHGSQLLRGKEL